MKHIILASALLGAVTVQAAQPSDQSIDQLLELVNLRGMLEQTMTGISDGMKTGMQQGIEQSMHGRALTTEQRRQFDQLRDKMMATARADLSYEKVRDIYRKAYRNTFTQEDVDGLIAFFKSPAGKAYVQKLPAAMESAGNEVQSRIGPLIQKMNGMQQDFMQQLQSNGAPLRP